MIQKDRGHLWIGKAAKIRCFLSRVSRQQSTCNGLMFVIKNHANKNRLIKNLVIYVPTKSGRLSEKVVLFGRRGISREGERFGEKGILFH